MSMQRIGILLLIASLMGCAATSNPQTTKSYVINTEAEHHIGEVTADSRLVKFSLKRQGDIDRQVTINIDSFPYSGKFDLCKETGIYQHLVSVTTNPDKKHIPIYSTKKVNCDSWIHVQHLKNDSFMFSYEIKLLRGFNIKQVQGFDLYQENMTHLIQRNVVLKPDESYPPLTKSVNGLLVESTTIDFSL